MESQDRNTALRFEDVRRLVITSVFSDDWLLQRLVLKGGNALNLVHRIGARTSVDIDLSAPSNLGEPDALSSRLEELLSSRFRLAGFHLFDYRLNSRGRGKFAGYEVVFKIIPVEKRRVLRDDVEAMRREASEVAPRNLRNFKIQISLNEFCGAKTEFEMEHYIIYAYTPEAIAIEKVRAICQQMPPYRHKRPGPRARDFYDIWAIESERSLDIADPTCHWLFRAIFEAKDVPLEWIANIPSTKAYHASDWPSVVQSVGTRELLDFDFYFDYLCSKLDLLKALWVE